MINMWYNLLALSVNMEGFVCGVVVTFPSLDVGKSGWSGCGCGTNHGLHEGVLEDPSPLGVGGGQIMPWVLRKS